MQDRASEKWKNLTVAKMMALLHNSDSDNEYEDDDDVDDSK